MMVDLPSIVAKRLTVKCYKDRYWNGAAVDNVFNRNIWIGW